MDKATLIFLKRIIKADMLLDKELFLKLLNKEKAEYINLVSLHRNGREAITINQGAYYDADDNEEITDLVEYAENLHDYGYQLFSK